MAHTQKMSETDKEQSRLKKRKNLSRRELLKLGASSALLSGFTASGLASCAPSPKTTGMFTTEDLEITNLTLTIPELAAPFEGLKIAFVTDLHHGKAIRISWLDRIISTVNSWNPDFFLLGGDYVWLPESKISKRITFPRNDLFSGLSKFELAQAVYSDLFTRFKEINSTYGTFGIMGNHDRWIFPKSCIELFQSKLGEILVNDRTDIKLKGGGTVELYGSDDYWNGIPKRPSFSQKTEGEVFRIFLTHNPDHIAEECKGVIPRNTLCLCGHTHGGQMRLPGFGAVIYNIRSRELGYGHKQLDDFHLFTSRGIGVVEIPYRINCPQEIVFITLSRNSH